MDLPQASGKVVVGFPLGAVASPPVVSAFGDAGPGGFDHGVVQDRSPAVLALVNPFMDVAAHVRLRYTAMMTVVLVAAFGRGTKNVDIRVTILRVNDERHLEGGVDE
jgi:hypothetical protein